MGTKSILFIYLFVHSFIYLFIYSFIYFYFYNNVVSLRFPHLLIVQSNFGYTPNKLLFFSFFLFFFLFFFFFFLFFSSFFPLFVYGSGNPLVNINSLQNQLKGKWSKF